MTRTSTKRYVVVIKGSYLLYSFSVGLQNLNWFTKYVFLYAEKDSDERERSNDDSCGGLRRGCDEEALVDNSCGDGQ